MKLQANIFTTILMLVFFFFSGLFGQPHNQEYLDIPISSARTSSESGQPLAGKIIVIDPGHGGSDPGTVGVGRTTEADNVLAIALDLKPMLEEAGATVIMTRQTNVSPAEGTTYQRQINGQLAARTSIANRSGADIFVSIHNDWNDNRSISGTSSYYFSSQGIALAESIQRALIKQIGSKDLGVHRGNFYVLRNTTMPSVLVEVGFISNKREADLLAQSWYRSETAKGIYAGIVDYFSTK